MVSTHFLPIHNNETKNTWLASLSRLLSQSPPKVLQTHLYYNTMQIKHFELLPGKISANHSICWRWMDGTSGTVIAKPLGSLLVHQMTQPTMPVDMLLHCFPKIQPKYRSDAKREVTSCHQKILWTSNSRGSIPLEMPTHPKLSEHASPIQSNDMPTHYWYPTYSAMKIKWHPQMIAIVAPMSTKETKWHLQILYDVVLRPNHIYEWWFPQPNSNQLVLYIAQPPTNSTTQLQRLS